MPDFLLEIGCEEIPARMVDAAREELARRVTELISRERLGAAPAVAAFSTPRRLAVLATGIAASQPDMEEQVTGPSVKVAFKDGQPTAAAESFAKKVGVEVGKLERVTNPKGEYVSATVTRKGRSATELLVELLPKEIAAIYWAKSMYWRAGKPERFVRPVQWLVAMLDSEVVPVEFGGITASNTTRGHRVLGPATPLTIARPFDYMQVMHTGKVLPDAAARRQLIGDELKNTASAKHLVVRLDDALLDTVVNLTEHPRVILGSVESEYLALPEEVLVTVMRDHQKYFAVEDRSGKLAPDFLAVLNNEAKGEAREIITHGNERVLRARFNDARFFWNTDQRLPLTERGTLLESVTFQKDLGSYAAKTSRTVRLVRWMAEQLAPNTVDAAAAEIAATLSKTDLTTELVKEFTELQGIVGGLYARAQGHSNAVADAIYDHYKPLSVEDAAPRTIEGALVAIADKADSIAGMFALGLIPSGSKDPFALRRAANGIIKIIHQHRLPYSLAQLMAEATNGYGDQLRPNAASSEQIQSFFRERLEFYLRDTLGHAYDVVSAVLAAKSPDDVNDAV